MISPQLQEAEGGLGAIGKPPGNMVKFRKILLEDRAWVECCRDPLVHPFSALSFPSLFTWQEAYGLEIAGDEDFFVVRSRENQGYFAPCGQEEKCRRFLDSALREEGSLRVLYLTGEQAEQAAREGFAVRRSPALDEYICSTKALALQEGHVSSTYRKKCTRFAQDFPYSAAPITPEDLPLLRGVLASWEAELGTRAVDLDAAIKSVEYFEALDLRGILVRTEKGPVAFSFGFESAPDTYTMAVVKYDRALSPAVTAVCTREEAEKVAFPWAFSNLEEDLGLPGLRDAKLQCGPVRMNEVYVIEK